MSDHDSTDSPFMAALDAFDPAAEPYAGMDFVHLLRSGGGRGAVTESR